jgi:hypothetical protein
MPNNRKVLGSPILYSDADLDALAAVSPADIAAAEALWRLLAPPWARDLLDAQVAEPE